MALQTLEEEFGGDKRIDNDTRMWVSAEILLSLFLSIR